MPLVIVPMMTLPAVTFSAVAVPLDAESVSAVFVVAPDAVILSPTLVELVPVRVLEIVAPVVVIPENEFTPDSVTFAAEKLPLPGPPPVITMSSNFAPFDMDAAFVAI